jgi:hypothetical protein
MLIILLVILHSQFIAYILCALFVAVSVILSQAALTVFNVWATKYKLQFTNEIANTVFGVISLIYSLILAFVIIAAWDDYNDLEKTIETEADKINTIITHIGSLPDSLKTNIISSIYSYCNNVINNEWKMRGAENFERPSAIPTLRKLILTTTPQSQIQENIFHVIDTELSNISDFRRERVGHSHSQIPPIVWFVLCVGSIMLVLFFFFFNTPTIRLKRIYLSFLVSCMAMCMFLVYVLDHPFNATGLSDQPYYDIQLELKEYFNVTQTK